MRRVCRVLGIKTCQKYLLGVATAYYFVSLGETAGT